VDLCEHFAGLLNVKGKVILSGIIEEQLSTVIQAYSKYFENLTVVKNGIWCRVDGVKL